MLRKSLRSLTALASALVLLALALTPASPAQAAVFSAADIFNPLKVNSITLDIPSTSATSLGTDPKKYVAASFTIKSGSYTMGPISVGVRLKGSTSLERLSAHPSFKVAFNWDTLKGNRLVGLKNITLNAMTQDGSKLHEFAAYKLHNAMNVPAPRTGWTTLKLNGVNKGLYLTLETVDDIFLATKYTTITQHLYEGTALKDFAIGNDNGLENDGAFPVKEGWTATPNKFDLKAFISAVNTTDNATWWKKFGAVADRSEWIRMWAVENFTGQWDGYSGPIINNYFVRSDIMGKFTIIPWGQDQTFGENRQTAVLGDNYFFAMDAKQVGFPWVQQAFKKDIMFRGALFRKCLDYAPCKTEYLTSLKAVSAKVTSIKLVDQMKAAAKLTSGLTGSGSTLEQTRTQKWVVTQQAKVAALVKKYKIK